MFLLLRGMYFSSTLILGTLPLQFPGCLFYLFQMTNLTGPWGNTDFRKACLWSSVKSHRCKRDFGRATVGQHHPSQTLLFVWKEVCLSVLCVPGSTNKTKLAQTGCHSGQLIKLPIVALLIRAVWKRKKAMHPSSHKVKAKKMC